MSERDNNKKDDNKRRSTGSGRPSNSDRPGKRGQGDSRGPRERRKYGNEESDSRESHSRKRYSDSKQGEDKAEGRPSERRGGDARRPSDRRTERPEGSEQRESHSRKRYSDSKQEGDKAEGRPSERRGGDTRRPGDRRTERPIRSEERESHLRKRLPIKKQDGDDAEGRPSVRTYPTSKPFGYRGKRAVADAPKDNTMRLNKYLANAGICTRREADELIKTGLVEVNGVAVTEMGHKVKPEDVVKYAGERLKPEKPAYYLLNKPKDYTAEMKATNDRRNGITLLRGIGNFSVLPIGKIDRSTSGLVIYTNDGELTMKLANPKFGLKKLFHVHLDKNLKPEHINSLLEGVELKEGIIKAQDVAYVGDKKDKKQIGIEIKSNKIKAVRSMLEELGYHILKLDRVMYAGLTKKDLPRGKWRELTQQEVINLKMLK